MQTENAKGPMMKLRRNSPLFICVTLGTVFLQTLAIRGQSTMTNLIPISKRESTAMVTNADGTVGYVHTTSIAVVPAWYLYAAGVLILLAVLMWFGLGRAKDRRSDATRE
jgi:hypothetical protein